MAEEDTTTLHTPQEKPATDIKGKGKAVEEKPVEPQDEDMDSGEDGEEMDEEEEEEEEDGDDMEEIDLENIVGRRTRGKKIDFTEEAKKAGNELDDDDDEDGDFVAPIEEEK